VTWSVVYGVRRQHTRQATKCLAFCALLACHSPGKGFGLTRCSCWELQNTPTVPTISESTSRAVMLKTGEILAMICRSIDGLMSSRRDSAFRDQSAMVLNSLLGKSGQVPRSPLRAFEERRSRDCCSEAPRPKAHADATE